jgi:hypothetical protein
MLGPTVTLIALALSLAWAIFLRAGVYTSDWVSTVLFVGCISLVYWMFVRRRLLAPPLPTWVRYAIWALPCYCAFQLLPLPLGLLRWLSPARAELLSSLAPVLPGISRAPISVNPPQALLWGFSILCYLATFFLVRELSWRFAEKPWSTLSPLILIASIEAVIGIVQIFRGGPDTEGSGSYTNRDHFSGMLEMILPLTVMFGLSLLRRKRENFEQGIWPAAKICAVWALSAVILVAIVYSLSRMGSFVALPSQNFRMASLTLLAVVTIALFIFLPPDQLIERFAEMSASSKIPADARVSFWKEILPLIGEFRWLGCGLGGFESTFLKYQGVANAFRVEMAQNDYLQYLAELGLIGFSILIAAVVGILIPVVKGIIHVADENRRSLLVACAGSFVAVGLHSLVDFNLYIPANSMMLAWIAGVASVNGLD